MTNLEGVLSHSGDDVLKKYLGGEGVAMVNYRLHVGTVPAVDLQTAAAFPQSAGSHTHAHKQRHVHTMSCASLLQEECRALSCVHSHHTFSYL